eukprot:Rhum_TRINITY_DN14778_c3_g1::Rhum_TRINITY_DN14778_c3_g1_i3::g.115860::m.115860
MLFLCAKVCCAFAVLLAWALWHVRARRPKGLPLSKEHEAIGGITIPQLRKVIFAEAPVTCAEFIKDVIAANGWSAVGWSHVGGKRGIYITHPDDVKHVLTDKASNYVKGPMFINVFKVLLGDGIFNSNGEQWRHQRMASSGLFSKRRLRDRMSTVFGTHAQELSCVLAQEGAGKKAFDIQALFFHYTFDCINGIAFNRSVNSLRGNEADCEFQAAFDAVQENLLYRFMMKLGVWQLCRLLNVWTERRLKAGMDVVHSYMEDVLSAYYNEDGSVKEEALRGDGSMTALFLEHGREEGLEYSREYIRDMILNTTIAGRDTTASALTSTVEFLCAHPEWQERLGEEAAKVFAGNTQEALTFDDIEGCTPVAEAVVLEAIRLHPPVPINEKVAVGDEVLPSGADVAAGESLWFSPYVTQRMPSVWGADAEEYKPERWLDGRAAKIDTHMFPAFNAGPRLCLGKNMALLEAKTCLLTLFARYRFSMEEGFAPKVKNSITWQLDGEGLRVTATEV